MKKIFSIVLLSLLLNSCDKDPATSYKPEDLITGSYLKLVSVTNNLIDYNNIANQSVGIKVNEMGSPVEKINLYVVEGVDSKPASWVLVKTVNGTGGETTLSVKASEIASALGISVADMLPGTQYTIYTEIVTKDGRTFNLSNANQDLAGQPTYAAAYFFSNVVFCAYDPATTNNVDYTVVEDQWGDFAAGSIITVANGPGTNQFTLKGVYPASINHKDIVVDVDPTNGSATVKKQAYGTYASFPAVGDISAEGSGFIFSCTGEIILTLSHSGGGTDFGAYTIDLKK